MESDADVDEGVLREKALHLAAEVAETDDNNVPVLLLGLKDILDGCPVKSEIGTLIRIDLWSYDIIHVSNLALKQDFNVIRGQWGTAASLSVLLCQCCIGLDLPDDPKYESNFLPDVVESVLAIATKLFDNHANASLDEEKQFLLGGFKDVISGLEMLYKYHNFLSIKVMQSKRFMHILMAEDLEVSRFFMSMVDSMWKANRFVLNQLSQETLYSILDELVFKISASEETTIGRGATRLILTATDRHPTVVAILLSKRYKGLKAYLSKWNNRGFDGDVRRVVSLLEAGTAAVAVHMRLTRSATIIQAYFRGFKTRKQLKQADKGITLLQRKFRERQLKKEQLREKRMDEQERSLIAEQKKLQGFRSSMRKKLHMLETVPAREVNKFMVDHQDQAASTIQAAFRGMKTRKELKTVKKDHQRTKAATVIQRQYRRYKKKKDKAAPYPIPPGLTDARRVELQNIIVNHRERFPTKHRTADELKELHEKAHSLLANHLAMRMKTRKNEQKREALLARLKMDTDLLLEASSLQDANEEIVETLKSHSAPVIAKAQLSHNEELGKHKLSWWKKLWDDEPPDSLHKISSGQEELNF